MQQRVMKRIAAIAIQDASPIILLDLHEAGLLMHDQLYEAVERVLSERACLRALKDPQDDTTRFAMEKLLAVFDTHKQKELLLSCYYVYELLEPVEVLFSCLSNGQKRDVYLEFVRRFIRMEHTPELSAEKWVRMHAQCVRFWQSLSQWMTSAEFAQFMCNEFSRQPWAGTASQVLMAHVAHVPTEDMQRIVDRWRMSNSPMGYALRFVWQAVAPFLATHVPFTWVTEPRDWLFELACEVRGFGSPLFKEPRLTDVRLHELLDTAQRFGPIGVPPLNEWPLEEVCKIPAWLRIELVLQGAFSEAVRAHLMMRGDVDLWLIQVPAPNSGAQIPQVVSLLLDPKMKIPASLRAHVTELAVTRHLFDYHEIQALKARRAITWTQADDRSYFETMFVRCIAACGVDNRACHAALRNLQEVMRQPHMERAKTSMYRDRLGWLMRHDAVPLVAPEE